MFVVTKGCPHDFQVKGTFDTREAAEAFKGDADYEIDEVSHNLGPYTNQDMWYVQNAHDGQVYSGRCIVKQHAPVGFLSDVKYETITPVGRPQWRRLLVRSAVSVEHARAVYELARKEILGVE